MSNSDDLQAIRNFMGAQIPKTITGKNLITQWNHWIPTVSTFIYVSDDDLKEANRIRDQFNLAESPKAITAMQSSPQLSQEETRFFKDMPIVNTTGMSPNDAKSAIWNTKNNTTPPSTLHIYQSPDSLLAGSHKTVQQGSKNHDVGIWQQVIGVKATDNFDPATRKATIDWQVAHGLKGDGIVGAKTWSMALQYANPNGTALPSFEERATSVSGGNTIPFAVARAPALARPQVAAVASGSVTGAQAHKYLANIKQATQNSKALAELGMLPTGIKKVPGWAWAGMGAAAVAGVLYSVFGKPKMTTYTNKSDQ
jgi:peptidoglycan hydrolase-like protein with peptidoglycan-binding domain